jgi:hypothetical protein
VYRGSAGSIDDDQLAVLRVTFAVDRGGKRSPGVRAAGQCVKRNEAQVRVGHILTGDRADAGT